MRRHVAPVSRRLADPDAEQVRRSHEAAIVELQKSGGSVIIADVELEDSVATPIAHGLGKIPRFVRESCPRGATTSGRVVEVRSGGHDRRQVVVLMAVGWGATITVDLVVT